jgi:hypothetical protein
MFARSLGFRSTAVAAAPAGTVKTSAEEPIAAGLVFFAGSAPSASALIMRDQIANNAATLTGATPPTLNRSHPTQGGWVGADIALTTSATYWPLTTQIKTITTAHTVLIHVTLDSFDAWCALLSIPRSDTTFSDGNDGPLRWRRSSSDAEQMRLMLSSTATGRTEQTVDPNVALWSAGTRLLSYRRNDINGTGRVGGTQASVATMTTASILWPTTSHVIVSADHRNSLTTGRMDCGLFLLAIFARELSDSEVAAWEANPQILQHT